MAEQDQQKLKRLNYQACFSTDAGKKVLEDLDRECRYKKNAFNKDSARITDYNLGSQWVIQYVHNILEQKPEELQEKAISQ